MRHLQLTKALEHFWSLFFRDYLVLLRERHAQTKGSRKIVNTIRVGEVVLVHSDKCKRPKWKLAYVQELIYGKDGLVRSAIIRTKTGITNRPINKLYPLELNYQVEEDETKPPPRIPENSTERVTRKAAQEAALRITKLFSNNNDSSSDDSD